MLYSKRFVQANLPSGSRGGGSAGPMLWERTRNVSTDEARTINDAGTRKGRKSMIKIITAQSAAVVCGARRRREPWCRPRVLRSPTRRRRSSCRPSAATRDSAAINNAIARFNAKYPNVTVELSMDPISTGWGDYVTKVLGQFNAGTAADVYGTAIETFQAFSSRELCACRSTTTSPRTAASRTSRRACSSRAPTRGTSTTSPSAGTTS